MIHSTLLRQDYSWSDKYFKNLFNEKIMLCVLCGPGKICFVIHAEVHSPVQRKCKIFILWLSRRHHLFGKWQQIVYNSRTLYWLPDLDQVFVVHTL